MKILIYIIVIYLLIRFIRGVMNTHVVIHKFDNRYSETEKEKREREGTVTIISSGTESSGRMTPPKGEPGDYVDFEEVK